MISEKIGELIRQNLPETVAGELKQFIEESEKKSLRLEDADSQIEKQRKQIESNSQVISEQKQEISDLNKQIDKCEDCKARYSEITHREAIVALRSTHCDDRIGDMKEITSLAFRSPVYRKTVSTSKNVPVQMADNMGSGGECMQTAHDSETTDIVED